MSQKRLSSQNAEFAEKSKVRAYVSKRRKTEIEESRQEIELTDAPSQPIKLSDIPERISSALSDTPASQTGFLPKRRVTYLPKEHTKGVNALTWCGEFGQVLASASMDGSVKIWDVFGKKECVCTFRHYEAVKDVRWNNDTSKLLSGGYNKLAKLIDIETGAISQTFEHPNFITALRFNPTSPFFFASGMSKDGVITWDARSNKSINQFRKFWGSVNDLEFLPTGKEILTCSDYVVRNAADKNIVVWDLDSTTPISNQIYQEAYSCTALRRHPYKSQFVAQSNADYVAIFGLEKPWKLNKRKRFEGHVVNGYPIRCNFSLDAKYLASGDANGSIFFYDYASSNIVKVIENAHSGVSIDVLWHPVLKSVVATAGWEGGVSVWG